jgi:two-component system sensor kinase FixL
LKSERGGGFYRAIFDHSAIGVLVADADGRFVDVNPAYAKILGYRPDELVGTTFAEITHPDDIDRQLALFKQLATGKIEDFTLDKRFIGKQGNVVWVRFAAASLTDETGLRRGTLGMIEDITERKRTEEALANSETHLRSIIETLPHAVITICERGVVETFSPSAETLFGYRAEEVVGENVRMLMPEPYRSQHDGYLAQYRETGEKRIIGLGRIVVGRRKNGESFPMQLSVGESAANDRRFFTGIVQDITAQENAERELRTLQDELISVSRVSAMGEMGSGIAHELNQPLTAVINYVQACRRLTRPDREPNPAKVQDLMDKAVAQAERAGEIVRRLRTFIGKGETERTVESINTIVEEASALAMSGTSTAGMDVQIDTGAELPDVLVDRIQVQQVVLNLIRNAVEAMEDAAEKCLLVSTSQTDDGWAEVAVSDTGPGLPPLIAETLFEPFHTTKEAGMGIGLSICRTIVEAHEGRIWADTNSAGGTTFHFTVPLVGDIEDD